MARQTHRHPASLHSIPLTNAPNNWLTTSTGIHSSTQLTSASHRSNGSDTRSDISRMTWQKDSTRWWFQREVLRRQEQAGKVAAAIGIQQLVVQVVPNSIVMNTDSFPFWFLWSLLLFRLFLCSVGNPFYIALSLNALAVRSNKQCNKHRTNTQ